MSDIGDFDFCLEDLAVKFTLSPFEFDVGSRLCLLQFRFEFHQFTDNIPAPTDLRIRAMVAASARELGLSHITLPSGAGHDAQDLAQICPVGMVFVPSLKGISHAPTEFSSPEDITNGANVLLHTLLKVDAAF